MYNNIVKIGLRSSPVPDPDQIQIRRGPVSKNIFFRPFRLQFNLKLRGGWGRPPRPLPWIHHWSQDSFSVIEASSFVNCAIFCTCIFVKLSQYANCWSTVIKGAVSILAKIPQKELFVILFPTELHYIPPNLSSTLFWGFSPTHPYGYKQRLVGENLGNEVDHSYTHNELGSSS